MTNSKLMLETKALTEGAIMAALTAILSLAGLYLPVVGVLIMFVWTLPVVVICLRHSLRAGVLTLASAGLIIMILSSPITALNRIFMFAAPTLLLAYAFRKSWQTPQTILATTLANFVSLLLALGFSLLLTGVDPLQLDVQMAEMIDMMIGFYEANGMFSDTGITAEQYIQEMYSMVDALMVLLPSILLLSALVEALTNYFLSHIILRRLKIQVPPMGKLKDFRLYWGWIYGLIIGLLLNMLGTYAFPHWAWLTAAGANLIMVFQVLFFLQGMAVASYWMQGMSQHRRTLIKILLVMVMLWTAFRAISLVALLGIVDVFRDFRKIDRSKVQS